VQRYINYVQTRGGAAVSGASVLIKTYPAGVNATIYSDNGVTQTDNPLTTDANGKFQFYAADGRYQATISKTGVITTTTLEDILLADPDDGTAEQDAADVSFVQSGTGGGAEAVSTALNRLPHSAQYSSAANFTTALNALTGTQGLAPKVQLGWTTGEPFTLGRETNVFNGTDDEVCVIGYNVAQDGNTIPDATEASVAVFFESNYNDGTTRYCEWQVNMAGPSQSYVRPFAAYYALSGGNANKLENVDILSNVNVRLYGQHVIYEAQASYTTGAQFHLKSIDTGGQDWLVLSSGSGAGVGAGYLVFYNNTDGRYHMALPKDNVGLSIASTAAGLTDTDSDSFLQIGNGASGAAERTNIRWRNGGFAAASDANATSNGDKMVWWNAAGAKLAAGVDGNGAMFFQNHRPSGTAAASAFSWHGGIGTNTAERMHLDGNGNLGLGTSSFGTNAVTVFGIKTGTAPTTGPADTVQFYSSDNSAGNTIPSFYCEGSEVIATGQADSASSVRVKMRINGTVVTLLAI
jgi:hypothetical protein